jgi:VanZ family protein
VKSSPSVRPPRGLATRIVLGIYLGLLTVGTLMPFRFEVPRRLREAGQRAPEWRRGTGMTFHGVGMFSLPGDRPQIAQAIAEAHAFYAYLEARTDHPAQIGRRRLLSYSVSTLHPCVMIGQDGSDLVVRLPDPQPGTDQWLVEEYRFSRVLATDEWVRLLITCDPESLRAYRNGTRIGAYAEPAFDPRSWSRRCRLAVGNETTGDRGWRGQIRRIVLGAGLPPRAISQEAGVDVDAERATAFADADTAERLPLVDVSGGEPAPPAPWRAHKSDAWGRLPKAPWSLVPFGEPPGQRWARADWLRNVLLFLPLGWLLRRRGWSWVRVLAAAFALSVLIESVQIFIPTRHCQATDVVLNACGGLAGGLFVPRKRRVRA